MDTRPDMFAQVQRPQCVTWKCMVYVSIFSAFLRFMLARKLPETRSNKNTQLLMLSAENETVAGQWTGKGREARGLCLICRLHAHRNHYGRRCMIRLSYNRIYVGKVKVGLTSLAWYLSRHFYVHTTKRRDSNELLFSWTRTYEKRTSI